MKQVHLRAFLHEFRILASFLIIIVGFTLRAPGQVQPNVTPTAALSDIDIAAIRSVVQAYFDAFAKRDLQGLRLLWNLEQPTSTAQMRVIEKMITASEGISVGSVSFVKFTTVDTNAIVRVRASISSMDASTHKSGSVFDSDNRLFTLIRTDGSWKIIRHESVEADLANALARLKTDAERKTLMDANRDIDIHAFLSEIQETVRRTRIDENKVRLSNEILEFVLPIAQRSDDQLLYTKFLANLATGYLSLGEFQKAQGLSEQALGQFPKVNDAMLETSIWLALSVIRQNLGDYQGSIEASTKRLVYAELIGDPDLKLAPLTNIGNSYGRLGDYYRQIDTQLQALEVLNRIGEKNPARLRSITAAGIFLNLGISYSNLGYDEQAIVLYRKSESVRNELKRPDFSIQMNIGNIFYKNGDYAQALEQYESAFAGFESLPNQGGMASAAKNIGNVYLRQGDYVRALEFHSKALRIREAAKLPSDSDRLSIAYDQFMLGDLTSALPTAETLAKRPKLNENDLGSASANIIVGKIYRSMGNIEKSTDFFDEAIKITEKQRSRVGSNENVVLSMFEDPVTRYSEMAGIRIEQGRSADAFYLSERAKAVVLLDILINGKRDITTSMTAAERSDERRLKNELISLNSRISTANRPGRAEGVDVIALLDALRTKRLEFEEFQLRIFAAHPELRVQRGEMKPVTVEETASLLPDRGTAAIEYLIGEKNSFLFVTSTSAAKKAVLSIISIDVKEKDLSNMIMTFRSQLSNGDLDFQHASRALYDLLLSPVEKQLAGKTNLIIVPDGPLWDLPFQALMDDKGKYLIEKAAVSYAPSLTALREMQKKAKTRKPSPDAELLAFGNPIIGGETKERVQRVFMSEKLEPLPEAERLVNSLSTMYGPNRSKVYVGNDAREETAKSEAPKYRIVQFATHGILNNASPMYSHLVLAQNKENPNEDGLLEAWEMKDLDLKADMVILSACETARGRISNGEGVIGMSWAMFIAGTPTTVASQWKVESKSTTDLMLEFHRQLRAGKGISKAEALRRAELKLMKMPKYRHPSYWAGFVMIGDGS